MYEEEESADTLLLNPSPEKDVEYLFPGEGMLWSGSSLAEALLPLVETPASPRSPWLCSTRYKTELCTRYAETSSCKYAERCQFAHGLHELRMPSRHPKYKTELCRTYHAAGYCVYGARCLFVHGPEEQRQALPRRKNIPCRTFCSYGMCPFGSRCNFLHVKGDADSSQIKEGSDACSWAKEWKPRGALCRTFSSFGFCLYGTRCRFQHSLPSSSGSQDHSLGILCAPQWPEAGRALSLASNTLSSTSSSPPVFSEDSSPVTPPALSSGPFAHSVFSFSDQHLNDLLLPLAWRLQQLDKKQANATSSSHGEEKPLLSDC
ncbi:cysteine three histidine 1 [Scleropages formosus]|uniref:mRNA decay activator protein ZFP36 n=1 Tax=Scleropages formosus TaxID=113540 RepID=A0A8C9RZ99_SCLFO|nr:mRNA decay activator protein ZFP36L2-like [Scleropages formosus]